MVRRRGSLSCQSRLSRACLGECSRGERSRRNTRGRQEERPYPWSKQVIHEISGLGQIRETEDSPPAFLTSKRVRSFEHKTRISDVRYEICDVQFWKRPVPVPTSQISRTTSFSGLIQSRAIRARILPMPPSFIQGLAPVPWQILGWSPLWSVHSRNRRS